MTLEKSNLFQSLLGAFRLRFNYAILCLNHLCSRSCGLFRKLDFQAREQEVNIKANEVCKITMNEFRKYSYSSLEYTFAVLLD